jgi:3-carboxy-cis,cis-muconate cycloisomerase
VLCARTSARQVLEHLDTTVTALSRLARRHRDDVMAGRTLTQHAVPITFGLKAAQWLQGVLDARDDLRALGFPIQVGGAAGTLAAVVELAGDVDAAQFLVAEAARTLDLDTAPPWHTNRTVLTRYADAMVRASDAMGHIANDVLLLARPEIAELAEPVVTGRGGSSTMPQKSNPVLSVLIRRAALAAPGFGAQLHLAAAEAVDERPDGSWHTEWFALAALSRHTLTAASQTAELVAGLHVDTARMAAVVKQQASALTAEQRSMGTLLGRDVDPDPRHYLGATGEIIDEVLARVVDERQEDQ